MKKLLVILMLLPLLAFSQTKAKRHQAYYANCIFVVTDTFKVSGYLRLDTVRVSYLPTKSTYTLRNIKRNIIEVYKVNSSAYNLVLQDTIWAKVLATPYRSSVYYYAYPGHVVPTKTIVPVNYEGKHRVYKNKIISWKRERPLTYTKWAKINP